MDYILPLRSASRYSDGRPPDQLRTDMESTNASSQPVMRYGDFPDLFWDARPDVAIDVEDPVTLARLLTRGRAELIGRLVSLEILRKCLPALTLPEPVLVFWHAVLESTPPGTESPSEGA